MYQATIANVSGTTATDIQGKVYYIAGNNNIVRGQQVWTDGTIIYGNTYGGGDSPIITPILGGIPYLTDKDSGIIRIYDKQLNNYKPLECSGIENIVNNDKYVYVLKNNHWYGEKLVKYAGDKWRIIDACVSDEGDLWELGYTDEDNLQDDFLPFKRSRDKHQNQASIIVRKNGEIIDEVDWQQFYGKYDNEASSLASQGEAMIMNCPYFDENQVYTELENIDLFVTDGNMHPDGSWNIWLTTSSDIMTAVKSSFDIIHDRVEEPDDDYYIKNHYRKFEDPNDLDANGKPKKKIADTGSTTNRSEGIAGAAIVFDSEGKTQIHKHDTEAILKAISSTSLYNFYWCPFNGSKTYRVFYEPYETGNLNEYKAHFNTVKWKLDNCEVKESRNKSVIDDVSYSYLPLTTNEYYPRENNTAVFMYHYYDLRCYTPYHYVFTAENGNVKTLDDKCKNYRLRYMKNISKLKKLIKEVASYG